MELKTQKAAALLVVVFALTCLLGGMGKAHAAVETVTVPFTVHGHAVESGKGDGRSYFYIVLAEQVREVLGVEVTFTRDGLHQVWAIGHDGSTIKVGSGVCGKGTYQIPITRDMARLEFDLFTDEIPLLGLRVPGEMTVMKTPYAGHYLAVLGDSLSAAEDWKLAGNDPDAYNMTSQWWYAAAKEFGMNLLTNNSVGGTGVYQETAQGKRDNGLRRCTQLHTSTRDPDDIFVLLGANDILNGRTLQETAAGYKQMVQTMQKRYPKANIVLFTYPYFGSVRSFQQYKPKIEALNAAIRAAAKEYGVGLVELSTCPITESNVGQYLRKPDDIHFNRSGQALLGKAAVNGLYSLAAEALAGAG